MSEAVAAQPVREHVDSDMYEMPIESEETIRRPSTQAEDPYRECTDRK